MHPTRTFNFKEEEQMFSEQSRIKCLQIPITKQLIKSLASANIRANEN